MMDKLALFCFFAVILSAKSGLAPFVKPCKAGDSACIIASAQAVVPILAVGIPELGVKSLDPLRLDLINGDQGGLKLTFKDTIVTGMKGCHIENIKNNLAKGKQKVTIRCSVELNGTYKLGGQLLLLPVTGEGKYHIVIRDIVIETANEIGIVDGTDGKKHWHIDNWKFSSDVKTSTKFEFDNLFNGNEVLAKPVVQFMNENWRDVMKEVAHPIVRAIVSGVVDGVQALYKAVPVEELYIE